jgi:hypothetical protein
LAFFLLREERERMGRVTRHDRFALRALVAFALGIFLWLARPKHARATTDAGFSEYT